jgi:hypothetical protein
MDKVMKKNILVLCVFLMMTGTVYAKTVISTGVYYLGDGDSKIDARNLALNEAKRTAANKVGSYIESLTVVKNNQITADVIREFSAGIMKVKVINEKLSLTKRGNLKMTVKIKAIVDEKSVKRQLKQISSNRQKLKIIKNLERKNKALYKKLSSLNKQLKKLKLKKGRNTVQKNNQNKQSQRLEVLTKIEKNENALRKVFKKGTLFSLAKKSTGDYKKAKMDIKENVWQYIVDNTKINVGDPKFKDNGNGTYDVEVKVGWNMRAKPILKTLNKYFWDYKKNKIRIGTVKLSHFDKVKESLIKVSSYHNEGEKKLAYSDKLYKYYTSKKIVLQISAGKYNGYIGITGNNKTSRVCSYCYNIQTKFVEKAIFNSNPVVIRNVPASVLEDITSIDAKLMITNESK